ncbi:MAG: SIR2 family NAD-dependent protein deacylase [Chloroflexota bacterium]
MNLPDELVSFLRRAGRMVVLTGAGVSQESGLRTFRDAQSGLWAQYRPEDLATPEAFARDPKLVWDWYAMRREKVRTVEPNPAHLALARMARFIPDFCLVTQNVDGLHQKAEGYLAASFPLRRAYPIIELHGNLGRVKCASCGGQAEAWEEAGESVPRCASCGGLLRPDVVWFGEALPRQALEQAAEAARGCQAFFSIGTSGLVQPAAALAFAAHNRGAVVVEVNAEPTPLTEKADFALHGKAGEILPALVEAVWPGAFQREKRE